MLVYSQDHVYKNPLGNKFKQSERTIFSDNLKMCNLDKFDKQDKIMNVMKNTKV